MDQRLRPNDRIRKRHLFQVIFEKGHVVRGKLLNLWVYSGAELGAHAPERARLGVVVTKKTSLRANVRNLWKRRIREGFRKIRVEISAKVSVLVQSRKQEKVPPTREIENEIKKLLAKAGILR